MRLHQKLTTLAASAVLALAGATAQAESIELNVMYPYAYVFKDLHEEIAERFMAENPNIRIRFQSPAETYEDATQRTLRGAMTGQAPDVAYHGLNRVRVFVEQDVAQPLDDFIAAEENWDEMGYLPSMLSLGEVGGKTYGLPFSISTPIVYFNPDLVRQAGGDPDNFPQTWEEITELGSRISQLNGNTIGAFFEYQVTGNWLFLALVHSTGGDILDPAERKAAFNGSHGEFALNTLRMFGEAGMPDLTPSQAMAAFTSGTMGIYITSTSRLGNMTRQAGDRFELRTAAFPVPDRERGLLPAGGNVAMIHTKDPKKQQAAWEYIKFATGPVGQTLMVNYTGYMPGNDIPVKDPDMLGRFYDENPNHMTSIRQMPIMTKWYAFPGQNGLAITDVIHDHMQSVVTLQRTPEQVLPAMVRDVERLLPQR